jgi:hypothetical protein
MYHLSLSLSLSLPCLCLLPLSLCIAASVHSSAGFLSSLLDLRGDQQLFYIRQVPGDGGCLFHALASWLSYGTHQKHIEFDWRMRYLSNKLREQAVSVLKSNITLHIEDGESVQSSDLLDVVGDYHNMSVDDYCRDMLNPTTWGGGPEIVALSNHFKCPIHIYNLCTVRSFFFRKSFQLELSAKFGSPKFDSKAPIHLLCADGRFPDIRPGQQKEVGDHFLALFPCFPDKYPCVNIRDCPHFRENKVVFDSEHRPMELPRWLKSIIKRQKSLPALDK